MAYRPPVAIYDACVLYPFHLRNLLVQFAVDRLVDARWTDEIHDEWVRNLVANEPRLAPGLLQRTRDLMNQVLPDANVIGYERHLSAVSLNDQDDRHVVAAAIEAGAGLVLTWNVRDFPESELARHRLKAETPDDFVMQLYDVVPELVVAATANARHNLTKSRTPRPSLFGRSTGKSFIGLQI
jgi:PIN domain